MSEIPAYERLAKQSVINPSPELIALRQAAERIRQLEAVIESETLWLDYVPEQTATENWFGLFRIDGKYWRANSWGRDASWRMFPLIRVPDDHATTLMGTLPTDEEADDE